MDERVLRLDTPKECEIFAKNAEPTHPHLAVEARRRAVELRASAYGATSDAEREALEAIYAVEEIMSLKNGKRTRASRTWQNISRYGILETVSRVVTRSKPTDAYKALVEQGMEAYTFEAVVLKHQSLFSAETIAQAQARMNERTQI